MSWGKSTQGTAVLAGIIFCGRPCVCLSVHPHCCTCLKKKKIKKLKNLSTMIHKSRGRYFSSAPLLRKLFWMCCECFYLGDTHGFSCSHVWTFNSASSLKTVTPAGLFYIVRGLCWHRVKICSPMIFANYLLCKWVRQYTDQIKCYKQTQIVWV